MQRQLVIACLIIAAAAELLEANVVLRNHGHYRSTADCPEGHVKCHDGQCLQTQYFCDGWSRCADNQWPVTPVECPRADCRPGQISCPRLTKCLEVFQVCNGYNECFDNSDEENCETRVCDDDYFRCNSGQCVRKQYLCEVALRGCVDGTDLTGVCLNYTCPSYMFRCQSDGTCISTSFKCDGIDSCPDGSDEFPSNCPPRQCSKGSTRCPNRIKCINDMKFCDTQNDCGDNSDEAPELCNNRVCKEDEVKCANGQCIDQHEFCDQYYKYSCVDGSLSKTDPAVCKPYQCPSGALCPGVNICIEKERFCDTINDCGIDSEETPELCNNRVCEAGQVSCASGQCINMVDFCSGRYRCQDGSRSREETPACGFTPASNAGPSLSEQELAFYVAQHQCLVGVQAACRVPTILQQFTGLSVADAIAKINEMDLSEPCASFQEFRDCALASFGSNHQCQFAELVNSEFKKQREFMVEALDYVCVQHFDVINREKSCLLRLNELQTPVIALNIMSSCATHIQSHGSQATEPFCISHGLQQCAKNAIAVQCGQEIATVADGLANKVKELCPGQEAASEQHVAASYTERHARGMKLLRRNLGLFF